MIGYRSFVWLAVLGMIVFSANGHVATSPKSFKFDGKINEIQSPSRAWRLTIKRLPDKEAPNLQELRVFDRDGTKVLSYQFDRWMDGQWSPSGNSFFFNDYMGPGTGGVDCFLPEKDGTGWRLVSLLKALKAARNSGPKKKRLHIPDPDNTDSYVICSRWLGEDVLDVGLEGRTDDLKEFRYKFRYTVSTKRLDLIP